VYQLFLVLEHLVKNVCRREAKAEFARLTVQRPRTSTLGTNLGTKTPSLRCGDPQATESKRVSIAIQKNLKICCSRRGGRARRFWLLPHPISGRALDRPLVQQESPLCAGRTGLPGSHHNLFGRTIVATFFRFARDPTGIFAGQSRRVNAR